jgi:hypothetical protein
VNQKRVLKNQRKELLVALEKSRTRLAVAIAAESKITPLDRWQYYLDTADRMRRCIKKLRHADFNGEPGLKDWNRALYALRQLPVHDTAWHLCRFLGEIVAMLE